MKLRQALGDFKVEELSDHIVRKDGGKYRVYLLEKRGLETFSLISYLSKANKVPFSEFGYAGLKDKHAVTKQYLTVPAEREISTMHERSFDLELLGYSDAPVGPGQLRANRFEITVRDLLQKDIDGALSAIAHIEGQGLPNYFDSQRFGSAPHGEFAAKHILKGDLGSALKVHLTHYGRKEDRTVKEDKRRILACWDDLSKAEVRSKHLSRMVDAYVETGSWERAYMSMPRNMRELLISAYQSHLWNECVKMLLEERFDREALLEVEYPLGKLLFPKGLWVPETGSLPETFPVIGSGLNAREEEMFIISKVLEKEGVELGDFDRSDGCSDRFRTYTRDVMLRPGGLSISAPERDELNASGREPKYKVALLFTLPKGSYATIVIKGLFGR